MTLDLPRLASSREAADALVSRISDDVKDASVTINCRDLLSGSPSFADQLVKRLLVEKEAKELVLVGAPRDFTSYVRDSATSRSVATRVREAAAGAAGSA